MSRKAKPKQFIEFIDNETMFTQTIKRFKDKKVFKGDVYGNETHKIGLFNHYKLKVDYSCKKIFLEIYNSKKEMSSLKHSYIDNNFHFEQLKQSFFYKLFQLLHRL